MHREYAERERESRLQEEEEERARKAEEVICDPEWELCFVVGLMIMIRVNNFAH